VYSLDPTQIDRGRLTEAGAANLSVGESLTLDDGTTVTFTGFREFAALQYSHDPGQGWVLAAAVALLLGLLGMLLVRRERVFARVTARPGGGGTVLTLATLTRGSGESGPRFAALSDDLAGALAARTPAEPEVPPRDS
jgi:cytochrome c biogenesis protein